jgi:hypothetical protein
MLKQRYWIAALWLALSAAGARANIIGPWIQIDPMTLAGAPGATVGWDFVVHGYSYDPGDPGSRYWISITDVQIQNEVGTSPGVFQQYIFGGATNTDILVGGTGPNSTWAQTFVAGDTGFGAFLIDPGAVVSGLYQAQFLVHYDRYDQDPAACGGCSAVDYGLELPDTPGGVSGPSFAIQVIAPAPEPGSAACALLGGLALVAAARRSRATRRL